MKKHFFILLIILYFTKINAQNLIPSKNFSAQKNFSPEKIYKEFTSGEQESSPKETDDFETLVKYYNRNKKDDLHKTECENALKFIKNKLMDSSRKQSPFKLLGNAGAGNITADNLQKTIGSMSIGCQVRIGPYYLSESESYVNSWYIYALWNTKIGTSSDSSILQKNVLFPEIGKRDFVIGLLFNKTNLKFEWNAVPFIEIALNSYIDTSASAKKNNTNYSFKTISFLAGEKFIKNFSLTALDKRVNGSFTIQPYYQIISIDPKYSLGYTTLTKESNAYPTIHSLGVNTILELGNLAIFCNTKYILNKSSDDPKSDKYIASSDFKRLVYSIGTLISL